MYRLRLVCKRFNEILEKNAKMLPRYQSKKVGPLGHLALVYRYGTGAFEPPCACLDLIDVPSFLRHDIIYGFIQIDKMELTDNLFIALNELTFTQNVQKVVFSKIDSVSFTQNGMCTFLDKFPNLWDLSLFGHYEEEELGLHQSQVVMRMQRSKRGNGILTGKEIKSMAERLKHRKRRQIKRFKTRAATRSKAARSVQDKHEELQEKLQEKKA
ncbi:unnamed protein product [Onchocerca flexuosa]|uniref:F-box domain-containing protein n=1 Tax=Onchocerca flexuosa TaxID=387005 RepID=A0A183H3E7_9BILA|nr:unnamed protein product [Onchocerca flexuosa]